MKRPLYIFLAITIVGALVTLSVFPYYWLELGVKSCKGPPTDLNNCGDADMGGIGILFLGFPILVIGLTGTVYCLIKRRNSRTTF